MVGDDLRRISQDRPQWIVLPFGDTPTRDLQFEEGPEEKATSIWPGGRPTKLLPVPAGTRQDSVAGGGPCLSGD